MFRLREDDTFLWIVRNVLINQVFKNITDVVRFWVNTHMLDVLGWQVFQIFNKVEVFVFFHQLKSYLLNPIRNCRREQSNLECLWFFLNKLQYFINVRFESHVEHSICFIKNQGLNFWDINWSSFNQVNHSSCCSNNELWLWRQHSFLCGHAWTSIDIAHIKLSWVQLDFV